MNNTVEMEDVSRSDDPQRITDMFEDAFKKFLSIEKSVEPSNSPAFYAQVKKCITLFEDITRAVSMLGLFSSNEGVEEIATEDLKYLLLPAFLGSLTLRLEQANRAHHLDAAEIYFKDFIKRCKEYGLTDVKIPCEDTSDEGSELTNPNPNGAPPNLSAMVMNRNEKLRRFNEQKEYEKHLEMLRKNANGDWSSNEEQRRDYHLTLVRFWINKAIEEIQGIQMERPLLQHMEKMKAQGKKVAEDVSGEKSQRRPLKAVLITKDKIQKAVFGAGYPSLPVMTVDEFYEQRVKSGEFPDPCCRLPKSLQDTANEGGKLDDGSDDEDRKKTEEEEAEELRKARDWDEHKDTHRRGWGNRMNRS